MTKIVVGDGYTVRDTPRNRRNSLMSGKEARISHVSHTHVSVTVIQSAGYRKLLVPLGLFGENFAENRNAVINIGYRSREHFKELYK